MEVCNITIIGIFFLIFGTIAAFTIIASFFLTRMMFNLRKSYDEDRF